ncbi:hypothetical protein KGF86_16390 [Ornithinibacillus massiliensis]|uniref:DUF3139 domain-containing protein n=1 Tax=Ornithinibacillus massiliensis TaxID=1944633 RepID=A0ABS5MHG2_9BACI|nr:hypothetical protein [Ornithinibacillus massiliensis]MBS3681774.1 hypothetical protein [Ornithinibacillus massiliensis]
MSKYVKITFVITLVILAIGTLYSTYSAFIYGNPKKIIESEEIAVEYLKEEKGYQNPGILMVKGNYNWKGSYGKKYGGFIILKDNNDIVYSYVIRNDKIIVLDDIPTKY